MRAYYYIHALVTVLAIMILSAHVLRIVVAGVRQRQAGVPVSIVGASMTAQAIGICLALAGAVGGGYLACFVLGLLGITVALALVIQVAAGLVGSWIIARIYFGWLLQPTYRWFAGEEGAGQDG